MNNGERPKGVNKLWRGQDLNLRRHKPSDLQL